MPLARPTLLELVADAAALLRRLNHCTDEVRFILLQLGLPAVQLAHQCLERARHSLRRSLSLLLLLARSTLKGQQTLLAAREPRLLLPRL